VVTSYNGRVDRDRLAGVSKANGIELVVQFGSTVTGAVHPQSDLDLAVLLANVPDSYAGHAGLMAALQPCFPGRHLDLVVLNHADPLLLDRTTQRGRLLYGSPNRWEEFRAYAFRRYQDHRPFLEMEREFVERAIASGRR
jgi:predicted nucleotidyltransferase